MADVKISALPASATPLAGTETLPIVQSGATKQVSVANLTAGRVVAASGVNVSKSGNTFATVGTVSSGSGAGFQILDLASTPTKNNLLIAVNYNISNTLEITPSTTAGGSTYSTPMVTLDLSNGNVKIGTGNLVVGTASKGISLPGGITWTSGAGSPEGVVTAPVGSLYSRSNGGLLTSLYVKESGSGNTGWVGK